MKLDADAADDNGEFGVLSEERRWGGASVEFHTSISGIGQRHPVVINAYDFTPFRNLSLTLSSGYL